MNNIFLLVFAFGEQDSCFDGNHKIKIGFLPGRFSMLHPAFITKKGAVKGSLFKRSIGRLVSPALFDANPGLRADKLGAEFLAFQIAFRAVIGR